MLFVVALVLFFLFWGFCSVFSSIYVSGNGNIVYPAETDLHLTSYKIKKLFSDGT